MDNFDFIIDESEDLESEDLESEDLESEDLESEDLETAFNEAEPVVKDLVVKESPLEIAQRMKNRIMANADELIETAIKSALKGNKQMLKICLNYILPSTANNAAGKLRLPQGGISLEAMPDLAASLLSQVSEGTIDAKAAKELAEVMGVFLQSHEMVEAERRLDRLEAITKEVEERRKSGDVIDLRERMRLQEEVFGQ